ncbi:MAG: MCE family protein [Deltaproteobacteria bacterium]|nr:MCE family protein [Deltaproteobacteria bacterium]
MASPRSIEVKVGILILTALVLLGVLVLVMGGISFQPTFSLYVGFDNPGGLQSGAPVKIAGVKVGSIDQIEFRAGPVVKSQGASSRGAGETLVRVKASIEKRYREGIHDNAVFYVTTQGVLGEQFLAIDPGSGDRPPIAENAVVRGLDPPRLDRLLAEAYELLNATVTTLREHKPELSDALGGLAKTLKGSGEFMERNQDRLDRIATNVEQATAEGAEAVRLARDKYVENPHIDRVIQQVDYLTAAAAQDVPVLLSDGRKTLDGVGRIVAAVSSDEELGRLRRTLADVSSVAQQAKDVAADARAISAHVRHGRGSVGALVMEEQLFDDLQELARDLKHNPWKFFWKE